MDTERVCVSVFLLAHTQPPNKRANAAAAVD